MYIQIIMTCIIILDIFCNKLMLLISYFTHRTTQSGISHSFFRARSGALKSVRFKNAPVFMCSCKETKLMTLDSLL